MIRSPKGLVTGKGPFLITKLYVLGKKVCYKSLCAKTVSVNVVRHSLAYLTVHRLLAWDVHFYVKFSV